MSREPGEPRLTERLRTALLESRFTPLETGLGILLAAVLGWYINKLSNDVDSLRKEISESSKELGSKLDSSGKDITEKLSKMQEASARMDGRIEAKLEELEHEAARKKQSRVP